MDQIEKAKQTLLPYMNDIETFVTNIKSPKDLLEFKIPLAFTAFTTNILFLRRTKRNANISLIKNSFLKNTLFAMRSTLLTFSYVGLFGVGVSGYSKFLGINSTEEFTGKLKVLMKNNGWEVKDTDASDSAGAEFMREFSASVDSSELE
jgi:hypothetical protein